MTDFRVGDRVRLVVEGTVTERPSEGEFSFNTGVDDWSVEGSVDYTVEVLERKPREFAPGSVVTSAKRGHYEPMARTRQGTWLNLGSSGAETIYSDTDIQRYVDLGKLVLHEPPA